MLSNQRHIIVNYGFVCELCFLDCCRNMKSLEQTIQMQKVNGEELHIIAFIQNRRVIQGHCTVISHRYDFFQVNLTFWSSHEKHYVL